MPTIEEISGFRRNYDRELFLIGQLRTPEEKSNALRGRLDLAVNCLIVWDILQNELRGEKNVAPIRHLLHDELKEVYDNEEKEIELVRLKDKARPWYERERANDYWSVANEMADVLVLVVADMRLKGADEASVFDALAGRGHHNDKQLIQEMIARTAALGMDIAEVIAYKTEINMQHRDPSLLSTYRANGFMKRMRKSIGDESSQIPHLAQGFLGVTILSKIQSPRYFEDINLDLFNLGDEFSQTLTLARLSMIHGEREGVFEVV